MNTPLLEALSAALLVAVLAGAVLRPFGLPEAAVAVPAAVLVLATGALPLDQARDEAARLGPVAGFLAAVLVLARLCDDEGLFRWCGAVMACGAPGAGTGAARRLLGAVFVLASLITAALCLDATVVLLTPVVFATAARLGVRPKPHVYACAHLANTASLLLPVSNLTNLLAFAASGLSFIRFAALMMLPWLLAVAAEYLVLRRFFSAELASGGPGGRGARGASGAALRAGHRPVHAAGFVLASALGVAPAWAAAAGAAVLGVRALARRRIGPAELLSATAWPFLAFVVALGLVVRAVVDGGLGDLLGHLVPAGSGLGDLFAVAALAAVLANVINNLPAVLVLLPLTAEAGTGPVLAMLLGVNIGPNLTYAGSLATLLWRRIAHRHAHDVDLAEFTRLGALTVPSALAVAVPALWLALLVIGG